MSGHAYIKRCSVCGEIAVIRRRTIDTRDICQECREKFRPRVCLECGCDILDRGPAAKRCVRCARLHNRSCKTTHQAGRRRKRQGAQLRRIALSNHREDLLDEAIALLEGEPVTEVIASALALSHAKPNGDW